MSVIKCDSVYKIFGTNAKKMLESSNGNVEAKVFQEAGCIVGVNNASFEVSKGEMLVVMGLSGSGKSTLLRCISRLTDATGGKIFIDGKDLLAMKNKELIELRRNKMGMVFQSFALLPHKTVLENIAFPLREHENLSNAEIATKVAQALELVSLEGIENKFPSELSGGMRKRVGLARAIILQPQCVLYDEPTTGLDPITTDDVDRMILDASSRLNVTSVVISHDVGSALNVADDIAVIHQGVIVEDCKAQDIKNSKHPFVQEFLSTWFKKQ